MAWRGHFPFPLKNEDCISPAKSLKLSPQSRAEQSRADGCRRELNRPEQVTRPKQSRLRCFILELLSCSPSHITIEPFALNKVSLFTSRQAGDSCWCRTGANDHQLTEVNCHAEMPRALNRVTELEVHCWKRVVQL